MSVQLCGLRHGIYITITIIYDDDFWSSLLKNLKAHFEIIKIVLDDSNKRRRRDG